MVQFKQQIRFIFDIGNENDFLEFLFLFFNIFNWHYDNVVIVSKLKKCSYLKNWKKAMSMQVVQTLTIKIVIFNFDLFLCTKQ